MGQVSCRIFLRVNLKEKQPIHKVARICNPYRPTGSQAPGRNAIPCHRRGVATYTSDFSFHLGRKSTRLSGMDKFPDTPDLLEKDLKSVCFAVLDWESRPSFPLTSSLFTPFSPLSSVHNASRAKKWISRRGIRHFVHTA